MKGRFRKAALKAGPITHDYGVAFTNPEGRKRQTGELIKCPKWRTSGFLPGIGSRQLVEMLSGFGKITEWGEASTASLIAP